MKCKIRNCGREIVIKKHGLCKAHANRFYQGRNIHGKIITRKKHKPYNHKKAYKDS